MAMKLWGVRIGIALAFNAITLWAASVLPGVRLGAGYWWTVIIFTAATLLIKPLTVWALARRSVAPERAARRILVVAAGLLGTVVALVLSSMLTDGFRISGAVGWILSAVVIWMAMVIYDFVDDGLEARGQQLLNGGRQT